MVQKHVLVTRQFPEIGVKMLIDAGFKITQWDKERPMTPHELISYAKNAQALFCTLTDKIDKAFFEANPQIEIVSQFAVGYDNIDVTEATKRNIPIGYTPEVLNDATADIAFGLMIATARKIVHNQQIVQKGEWGYFQPNYNLGIELKNKTLGIFGLGRIGMEMARRCKGAYNMNILYCNRNGNLQAEQELGAQLVSFEKLLAQSDIVSVHCALTPETKNIFNLDAFKQMKSNAIFINTARGLIHNETDLTLALQQKMIWGAGLDVSNPEPMLPNNPLLTMPSVTILPHVGSATLEARGKMAELTANNIIQFYKNKEMPHCVNPMAIT